MVSPEQELADLRATLAVFGINDIRATAEELRELRLRVAMDLLPDEELRAISDRAVSIVKGRAEAKQVRMLNALNRLGAGRAADQRDLAAILARNVHFDRLVQALEEAAES